MSKQTAESHTKKQITCHVQGQVQEKEQGIKPKVRESDKCKTEQDAEKEQKFRLVLCIGYMVYGCITQAKGAAWE